MAASTDIHMCLITDAQSKLDSDRIHLGHDAQFLQGCCRSRSHPRVDQDLDAETWSIPVLLPDLEFHLAT